MEVTRCTNGGSTSHIGKKQTVENEVHGTPKATATRVDAHVQTSREDRAKFASFAAMKFDEETHTSRSNVEMFSAADIMHRKLLEQMQCRIWEPEWTGKSQKKASRDKKRTRY